MTLLTRRLQYFADGFSSLFCDRPEHRELRGHRRPRPDQPRSQRSANTGVRLRPPDEDIGLVGQPPLQVVIGLSVKN